MISALLRAVSMGGRGVVLALPIVLSGVTLVAAGPVAAEPPAATTSLPPAPRAGTASAPASSGPSAPGPLVVPTPTSGRTGPAGAASRRTASDQVRRLLGVALGAAVLLGLAGGTGLWLTRAR